MFKSRIRLGRIYGVPILIDASWLLIFGWLTFSLGMGHFPLQYPSWSPQLAWGIAILTSLLFFASVLLHELGHALVARAQGNPAREITLFIFGGASELSEEPATPGREFLISASGPLVSLVLSGLFAVLHLASRRASLPVSALGLYLGVSNLSLGLFNLIPGFPLDGGRVLRSILWRARQDLEWATLWASRVGQAVAYVFIAVGISRAFGGDWVGGLWIAFIGIFMDNAARGQYARLNLRNLLDGYKVSDVMSRDCHLLPPQLTLDVLVDQYVLSGNRRCFTVGNIGKVIGLLTIHNVRQVPKVDWPFTRVSDVLTPLDQLRTVSPDTTLWDALQQVTSEGVNQVPVLVGDDLVGMIGRQELITFIRNRAMLLKGG